MALKEYSLELSHKNILQPLLQKVKVPISEYSFANLYLFRSVHNYTLIEADCIALQGITYDGKKYIMPVMPLDEHYAEKLIALLQPDMYIFPIHDSWLHFFTEKGFTYHYNDADSDYVYTKEKLATYSGKKLHSKKNLLNQFTAQYSVEVLPLTKEKINDALFVLEEWKKTNSSIADVAACVEACMLLDELSLCGSVYYVDAKPAAFIIGEAITDDMFAIHFAKAITSYKGIYQYLYNHCAKALPAQYKYFNFEQDLGLEPLRFAKRSYQPDMIIPKYRVGAKQL
ncbi:MAG: phosphatidylglycerol lysyltransferase domain-containing protein [Spirochaetes bacterium]|nr:phosphatidylglycerol lysyltransferase domain-containing protein [Spirochaetota bacterium]